MLLANLPFRVQTCQRRHLNRSSERLNHHLRRSILCSLTYPRCLHKKTLSSSNSTTLRTYSKPYDLQDKQVASICMTWESIELLSKSLRDALSDHRKDLKARFYDFDEVSQTPMTTGTRNHSFVSDHAVRLHTSWRNIALQSDLSSFATPRKARSGFFVKEAFLHWNIPAQIERRNTPARSHTWLPKEGLFVFHPQSLQRPHQSRLTIVSPPYARLNSTTVYQLNLCLVLWVWMCFNEFWILYAIPHRIRIGHSSELRSSIQKTSNYQIGSMCSWLCSLLQISIQQTTVYMSFTIS